MCFFLVTYLSASKSDDLDVGNIAQALHLYDNPDHEELQETRDDHIKMMRHYKAEYRLETQEADGRLIYYCLVLVGSCEHAACENKISQLRANSNPQSGLWKHPV